MSGQGFDSVQHKIVFIGDANTGKTTIIHKYMRLTQPTFPTVAASSFPISVPLQDSVVRLSCWDTAGQESYRCLVPIYARNAELACLVFDQANMASFQSLDAWLKYLESDVALTRVIIVSNKCDLPAVVPPELAFEFCEFRKIPLIATSATTGRNISFLFQKVAEMIREDLKRKSIGSENVELNADPPKQCC
jgi:small GTP-binding protein